ncbi:MAG: sirohydrochlorin cobaltochelatase [Prevotella sp.]|nr:sirohydrochlorin cobaltochelatase [Prevotella sp.]
MKRTLSTIVVSICLLCVGLHAQEISSAPALPDSTERTALLMVHYGTTHNDTRSKTIDAINERARSTFPGWEVRECYLSPVVVSRLAARGVKKDLPLEALLQLRADGYRRVKVQPTCIIDGEEMEALRRDVARTASLFDEVRVGLPLTYSVDDCRLVANILASRHPADARQKRHVVFVGHGSSTPATALYSQMDYMLKAAGHMAHHVATIEGYPTFDTCLEQLKAAKARHIVLVPFLFVAGNHAVKDIAGEWRLRLEQEGFEVEVVLEGLGEVPEIQEMYIDHIKSLQKP